MGENFSLLPQKCDEKNFQHCQQQNAVKKISPLKSQTLQIFTAIFNAYLKFTGNVYRTKWQVAQWNKKLVTCRRWDVRIRVRQFLFLYEIRWMRWKKIHPANLKKIHRIHRFAVRKVFSPVFSAILTLFFDKTSTRLAVIVRWHQQNWNKQFQFFSKKRTTLYLFLFIFNSWSVFVAAIWAICSLCFMKGSLLILLKAEACWEKREKD